MSATSSCFSNLKPTAYLIEALVLTPGSSEFVYDTVIQYDAAGNLLNSHYKNTANVIHTITKLLNTFFNLKEISLTVGWFGNFLKANEIAISPKI